MYIPIFSLFLFFFFFFVVAVMVSYVLYSFTDLIYGILEGPSVLQIVIYRASEPFKQM